MNYNKGCYRQTACGYNRPRVSPNDYNGLVRRYSDNTNCNSSEHAEMNYKLAMVYSPYQEWQNIYDGEKALENGTIFAELNKPFLGYKCTKGVCSL